MKKLKYLFFLLCLVLPMMASAMKIETDEVDEFTGNRTLITSWESLCNKNIHVRLRLQEGLIFLDFKMFYDGSIVIAKDDKLLIKSDNDSIATFRSIGMYSGAKGGGATSMMGSGAWGIMAIYSGDLSFFENNKPKLMRIYSTNGYIDKKLGEDDGKKFQRLYELFNMSLNGQQGVSAFFNCNIKFLRSKNGGKKWEEVNDVYYKDITKDELQKIVDDWKSQSSDNLIYDCQVKKNK